MMIFGTSKKGVLVNYNLKTIKVESNNNHSGVVAV